MQSNNTYFENSMNIHLLSFNLPKDIINDREDVRVSITTIPDERKQHFSIEGKKMYNVNHVFSLNITNNTRKVIMVFRKKTVFDDPIIASTIIHLNEFKDVPKEQITNGMVTSDVKTVDIYYPLQQQKKEEHRNNVQRKVLGQMQIQLSFASPFYNINKEKSSKMSKINNFEHHKMNKIQPKKKQMKNGYEKL